MSRETDTSPSGHQGRGGTAYPSGTPPYGSPRAQEPSGTGEPAQPASPASPAEKKTETTLTTRIRINIPGSRPIPPVVVRKPVDADGEGAPAGASEGEGPAERTARTPRARTPRPETDEPRPAPAPEKPASAWFAPRKPPAAAPPAASAAPETEPSAARPAAAPGPAAGGPGYATADTAPQDRPGGPGLPYAPDAPGAPAGPTAGPAFGALGTPAAGTPVVPGASGPLAPAPAPAPGGGASDDTAVLTPQKPHPGPPHGRLPGDTLAGGLPAVPQGGPGAPPGPPPFPAAAPAREAAPGGAHDSAHDGVFEAYPPALDEPAAPEKPEPAAPAAPAPVKKGRSKLVLLAVGVVAAAALAYGAGLLLNQADVPKGTTVMGVDIGGSTKEEAVRKLDAVLGSRAATPLRLEVGGQDRTLAPDKAGLSLDSQETVRAAAGSDYNPVSVIGSLFGAERVAEPVLPVDEEKLGVALAGLGGGSGAVTEGTVRFEPGKAVPVPGKAGTALDVQRSMIFVKDAFRAQVETGRTNVVELPVSRREPAIGQAEIDRAMKEFAEPAMSGLITVKAGGKQIQFGPQRSLPQILSMKAVGGRLEPYYDKKAIERLLDGTFDGVMVAKGDGTKHQLSADDVAAAMHKALRGRTEAERTVTIELDSQG
ncbi:hypothetical protein [Streptomyces somaliensis]|nr:hypothetical protein [Streptomyces somaliensis]